MPAMAGSSDDGIQAVALHHLGPRADALLEILRAPRQAAHAVPGVLQRRKQAAAHVARGAGQQDA